MKWLLLLLLPVFSFGQASVSDFGAKGDGVTNDAAAIQAALNSGAGAVQLEAGKTYLVDKPLLIPANTILNGNRSVLKPTVDFPATRVGIVMTAKKIRYKADALSIQVTDGDASFEYADAQKLKRGNLIELDGPVYAIFGKNTYQQGWYGLITDITGTTVTLSLPAGASFTASSLKMYTTANNVHITDLAIDLTNRKSGYGIGLINAVASSVENCRIESDSSETRSAEMGIYAVGEDLTISGNTIQKIRIAKTGAGYGINVEGHRIAIENNIITTARHGITSAGRDFFSTDILVRNNTVRSGGGSAPIDFHGNASGIIDSNRVYSTPPNTYGIAIRGNNTTVRDNIIEMQGQKVSAVKSFELAKTNIKVSGNKVTLQRTDNGLHGAKRRNLLNTIQ